MVRATAKTVAAVTAWPRALASPEGHARYVHRI